MKLDLKKIQEWLDMETIQLELERHKRIVACIRQLCKMRDTEGNELRSLYAGGEFSGIEGRDRRARSWMEGIADQHDLHPTQVDQLIRIVLDLD